jgi:hypothetical protein
MFVFPIENFETRIPELLISPGVKVRPLTKDERILLADKLGPVEMTFPKLPRHCLEIKAENFSPSVKKAYPIVSVLRLLKSTLVGVNVFLPSEEIGGLVYRCPSSMEVDLLSHRFIKGTYELEKIEESDCLNLSDKIAE